LETGHAEALMPMIAEVMTESGLGFAALDRIVVTSGPGTFTGVRTGIAAARALALATDKPVLAVSSLWAIARGAIATDPALGAIGHLHCEDDAVLVAMDARKGQVYAQIFDVAGHALTEPMLLTADQAAGLLPERRLIAAGNAASLVVAMAREAGREIAEAATASTARIDQIDAACLLAASERDAMVGVPVPLYLRPPDARPQADKSLPWSPS
jgi:tRNA threonylcarbamoyladenosine biosynthesis protein TsaB